MQQVPDSWSQKQRLTTALKLAREDLYSGALMRLRDGIERLSLAARAEALLVRVQRLGYRADPSGEWLQRGTETAARGGDCEDLGALFVALCGAAGIVARLVWLSQANAPQDHVTAQVLLDGRWVWADASILGARLGESSYQAAARIGHAPALEGAV